MKVAVYGGATESISDYKNLEDLGTVIPTSLGTSTYKLDMAKNLFMVAHPINSNEAQTSFEFEYWVEGEE